VTIPVRARNALRLTLRSSTGRLGSAPRTAADLSGLPPRTAEGHEEVVAMRLFTLATTEMARAVIDDGFYEPKHGDYWEFTDQPFDEWRAPFLLVIDVPDSVARENEIEYEPLPETEVERAARVSAEAWEIALGSVYHFDIGALRGEAVREFWLRPDDANRYRRSLVVYDTSDMTAVRPDLVGK
jgi:hypothetical protein